MSSPGNDPKNGPAAAPVALPSVLGYELVRELGKGHTGTVYLARQQLHGRMVALKIINEETLAGAHDHTVFYAQARTAASLKNPVIISILEAGDADGDPCLAWELVAGESLQQRLVRKPYAPEAAAAVVETLARAIHQAHEIQVVHGFLGPANVILIAEDSPRIADFGLAAFLHHRSANHPYPGDPAYAAPELAGGTSPVLGPATDVYGLGAILYALLTGRPPFLAASREETLQLVRSRPPVPPGRLHPGLSPDLETICLRCLRKRPSARYQSSQALAEDLHRYQEGRRIQMWPVVPVSRAVRWCRHNPWAATACLGLAMALGLTTLSYRTLLHNRDRAQAEAQRIEEERRQALQLRDQGTEVLAVAQREAQRAETAHEAVLHERNETRKQLAEETKARQVTARSLRLEVEARDRAEDRTRAAQTAERQAATRSADLVRDLAEMHVATGTRFMNDGNLAASLPWFTEALRLTHDQRGSEDAHRLRLAAVLSQCPRLLQVWHPEKKVKFVRFGPEGKRVLMVGADGGVVVMDTRTGKAEHVLRHGAAVNEALFSPDGKRVLTAGADQTVQLWDLDTGKEVFPALTHDGPIVGMAFRPNGQQLLTISYASPRDLAEVRAQMWNASTREPAGEPLGSQLAARPAEFSPDGKHLLTVCQDQCARLWDPATGKQVGVSLQHGAAVHKASFSPDGRLILTAGADNAVRVWDAAIGKETTHRLNHGVPVREALFSSGGRYVLTTGDDRIVRVWETATGEPTGQPLRHAEPVTCAAFSLDGRHVLTADESGDVRVWHSGTGTPILCSMKHSGGVRYAAFGPAGHEVLTFDGEIVRLWDLAAAEPLSPARKEAAAAARQQFSQDGRRAAQVMGRTVQLQDARSGKPAGPPLEHKHDVAAIAFSADGRRLLTICHEGEGSEVRTWDSETGKAIGKVLEHVRPVIEGSFSPDGRRLLTVCGDKKVRVWDTETGEAVGQPMDHAADLTHSVFSPAGEYVLTIDVGGAVRVWEAKTGQRVGRAFGHDRAVQHLAFSRDGKRVATGGADGTARVWELATGEPVSDWLRHEAAVNHVAFSADGKRVTTASADRTARVWDVETGKPTTPPLHHRAAVALAEFSADGRWLVTAVGNSVRLWDAASGEPLSPELPHSHRDQPVNFVSFDQGWRLVTAAGTIGDPAARWERELRPNNRPVADLEQLAGVLAGHRVRPNGKSTPWEAKELVAAWQGLRGKAATDTASFAEQVMAWQWRAAEECEARGLWQGTVAQLGRLLADASAPGELYARLGRAHSELRQWSEAQVDFSKAREANAGRWDLWAGSGRAAMGLGQWDRAVTELTKAIGFKEKDPDLWLWRGQAEAERGGWNRAAADLGKAIGLGRHEADVLYQHALALLGAGDLAGYRRDCTRLAQRSGDGSAASQELLVRACTLSGEPVSGMDSLMRAAEASPRSARDFERLGALCYRTGKFETAKQRMEDVVKLAGDSPTPSAWLFLAMANQRLGRGEEAQKWLNRATNWLDQTAASAKGKATRSFPWQERLEYQVLRREAEAMIKAKP